MDIMLPRGNNILLFVRQTLNNYLFLPLFDCIIVTIKIN